MKAIAKFLTVVTMLVLLTIGYIFWAAELKVTPGGGLVESAADRASAFESIRQSTEIGSPDLIMFQNSITAGPEQYVFVTYTLRMRNMNILPAYRRGVHITAAFACVLQHLRIAILM